MLKVENDRLVKKIESKRMGGNLRGELFKCWIDGVRYGILESALLEHSEVIVHNKSERAVVLGV